MCEQDQRVQTELLLIRCQQGDQEAFDLIVKLWQRPLLAFARRYLDHETDAWDALQDTWLAVVKGLHGVRQPSLFVPWLFRIMTNKCIDRLRKSQKEERLSKHACTEAESSDTSKEDESLRQAVDGLSDNQKILIMLRFGQGWQVGQIAAVLRIAEGTVKSRLHRALAQLRDALGDTHDRRTGKETE